ncbi:UNKNOWN [Stylonychia lemnae]|uniref:Uncharacterized protein n=1 Tax=Stylonychia lemnae TaxID=5949 RepID=A0A078AI24_STYLE|nr:UNKNOWN [Stylonychia lemnae]|eukprot:CDW81874.1 UNKNOWN [Stylonychia lemnae]
MNLYAKLEHLEQDIYFDEDDYDQENDRVIMNLLQQKQVSINETHDKQKLEYMLQGEKARQVAVMEKIQRLEKFREKLHKQAGKWDAYERKSKDFMNLTSDCNYGCSKQCYQDYNLSTVINTFVSCIAPQCKCLNSFALQHIPEPYFNETEFNVRRLDIVKQASERVSENWPTAIRKTYLDANGYDLIRDCDLQCHRDCFAIKKYVPFDTLLQCPRYRCNCWYRLDEEITKQIPTGYLQAQDWTSQILKDCDKPCAQRCLSSFASKPEVEFCVQYKCGCKIEQGTQSDLLMDRLGFNRDKYVSNLPSQQVTKEISRETIYDDNDDLDESDTIQIERSLRIGENDRAKIQQSEYIGGRGGHQYIEKNITQTPYGVKQEKIVEKVYPQALFHHQQHELDQYQGQNDQMIDQQIHRSHQGPIVHDPLRLYQEQIAEPKNWNFNEENFPYKDQIRIREYHTIDNQPVHQNSQHHRPHSEMFRDQSNINYTEFNIHVDLYPSSDLLPDSVNQIRQQHHLEQQMKLQPRALENILDSRELQEYQDFLRFKKAKELMKVKTYEQDLEAEEEEEEQEVTHQKKQEKGKKGEKAHDKKGKGKERKEGKGKSDYAVLYNLDELMTDNEIASAQYQSLSIFVLFIVTILLMVATVSIYKNFIRSYDDKNSKLLYQGDQNEVAFQKMY